MGTTEKGFRWPAGTDKVVDGDDAIHNLATDVDNSTWASSSTATTVPISGTASAAFTFPVGRFAVAPWCFGNASTSQGIIATPGRAQSAASVTMTIRNLSTTGANTIGCHLIAVAAALGTALAALADDELQAALDDINASRRAELRDWHALYVACVNPDCAAVGVQIEIWESDEDPLASVTCGTCGDDIPFGEEVP